MLLRTDEDPELHRLTQEKFKCAYAIFAARVQQPERRLMCSIYDVFAGPESRNHNCLGCNFDELTDQVSRFLFVCQEDTAGFTAPQAFSIYVQLLNMVWERIRDIFEMVSVPEGYWQRYFQPFVEVRHWANFFKHPKAYAWMVHHPQYTLAGSAHSQAFIHDPSYLLVDSAFLKQYYSADRAKGLTAAIAGHETQTVVVLPDMESLTADMCACLEKFVAIVVENPVYREILSDKATYVGYFAQQDAAAGGRP